MKIALVCTEMLPVPPVLGGAIQMYIESIAPIISVFHDITIYNVLKGGLPEKESKNNIKYIRVEGNSKEEYIRNIKIDIESNNRNYDLIHVYNRPKWIEALQEVAPQSKFSLSLHNEMMAPKKISTQKGEECVDKVEFICTVSNFIAREVVKLYPAARNKISTIYSAADINTYYKSKSKKGLEVKRALARKYNIEGHKVVLCVSRLSPKKGQQIVLEAMRHVMTKHPKTALVFIGSKWYGSKDLDEFTKSLMDRAKELNGPVIFTNFLTPKEIPRYFNIADIFVCASQWREPLARIHYEAMAAELPIITTNRGGNAELFKQNVNGIVINEYDNPLVMADRINYLLENPEIAYKMAKNAREDAENKYTFKRVAYQLLTLFDQVEKNLNK